MRFLIDSWGWIEYIEGSSKGEKVYNLIQGENEIYTLGVNVSEVVSRVKRKKGDFELAYNIMSSNSKILSIERDVAKEAGILHAKIKEKQKDFGLIDAVILSVARKINAKILTGDKHFKNFKEAVMLR